MDEETVNRIAIILSRNPYLVANWTNVYHRLGLNPSMVDTYRAQLMFGLLIYEGLFRIMIIEWINKQNQDENLIHTPQILANILRDGFLLSARKGLGITGTDPLVLNPLVLIFWY
jgi:hypothetical protein